MKTTVIIEKLYLLNKKYVTREEIKEYCKEIKKEYYDTIIYLIKNKYLITILRGVFYVLSLEERKYNKIDVPFYEIISHALYLKKIKNWYFGLDTATKLNNITHETINTTYIINDKIFRKNTTVILGKNVKFIKLKKKLFEFGITKDKISDLEKTILDTIYIAKYNREDDKKIINKVIDLLEISNKNKIKKYLKYYPKTVKTLIKEQLI